MNRRIVGMLSITCSTCCYSNGKRPYSPNHITKTHRSGVSVSKIVRKAVIIQEKPNDFTTCNKINVINANIDDGEKHLPFERKEVRKEANSKMGIAYIHRYNISIKNAPVTNPELTFMYVQSQIPMDVVKTANLFKTASNLLVPQNEVEDDRTRRKFLTAER